MFQRAVVAGRVRLDTKAQVLLPDVHIPIKEGVEPTLEHLATHSSGLPHMFDNWTPSSKELADLLAAHVVTQRAGEAVAYSNVGFTLLGDAVARAWGSTYELALHARVLGPLGMRHTGFMWSQPARARARGYDGDWNEVPDRVNVPTMAPCCVLESTAGDLLRLVHAYTDDPSATAPALALAARPIVHGRGSLADRWMALGWFVTASNGVLSKGGYMSGYRASVVVDARARRGVVVLANQSAFDADKLAFAVLRDLTRARTGE